MFFVIVTCSLHILPLQVMFSGKIIEYKYNGTFVWMNKLPVSCDEQDATRKTSNREVILLSIFFYW